MLSGTFIRFNLLEENSSKPVTLKFDKVSCLVESALLNETVILLPLSETAKSASKSIRLITLLARMALLVPDADDKLFCLAAN